MWYLFSPHPFPLTFRRAHALALGSPPSSQSKLSSDWD